MAKRYDPTAQQWVDDTPPPPISAIPPSLGMTYGQGINEMGGVDPEFDNLMAQLQQGRSQADADYTAGANALNTQYQPQYDAAAAQQDMQQKQLAAQAANNGIYKSGNYLQGAGDLGNQYAQQLGGLVGSQNQAMQDIIQKRLGLMAGYGQQEAAGQAAFAGRRGEEAKTRAQQAADTEAANQAAAAEQARNAALTPDATGQYQAPPFQTAQLNPDTNMYQAQVTGPPGGPQKQEVYSQNPQENAAMDWFNELQRYQDNPFMMNNALQTFQNSPNMFGGALQDPRFSEIKRRLGIG